MKAAIRVVNLSARIARNPLKWTFQLWGGIIGYPLEQLYQEVAYIAYYFHWQPESILHLDHRFRRQWVKEIASINKRLNQGA